MTYLIAIPACNAGSTLDPLVRRVRRAAPGVRILVVDDGSTDQTASVARALGCDLKRHVRNRGKGEALKTAFAEARRRDVDAVVHLDADGQHEPEYLPAFFAAFETGGYDIIVGARDFRSAAMPYPRRWSNRLTSWAVRRMGGVDVPDSQSGFRLVGRRALEQIAPASSHFDFESEFLILAARAGLRIGAVPVSTVYHGRGSLIRPWLDTGRFLRLVGRYWRSCPTRTPAE